MPLSTIILAAGQGKRMYSQTPKVLHLLAGKPLLKHVIDTTQQLSQNTQTLIIYGHDGVKVREAFSQASVTWVEQTEQLGTGHAVQQALPHLQATDNILVLYGDVPLIASDTLKKFIANTPANTLGILTANFANPTGLGRIIRDQNKQIIRIVEEKDATEAERKITEINSGIYLIPTQLLKKWLPLIKNTNTQKEYYLTDIISLAAQEKIAIHSIQPECYTEVLGINDRSQLATLERCYQRKQAEKLLLQGVTLMDPARFDLRGELTVGQDVTIDINVIIEGQVKIGNQCVIGSNTILRNVTIGDRTEIKANSVIDGAEIAEDCAIGPFSRLRPGTILSAKSHIGNFVEIKKSHIGTGTKVNHLSYIGDSEIGQHVNIGAGTITCNYDGVNKHKTTIGNNAFIGSNTALIAPVTIGTGATIGAGSTINRNAPADQLTLCRTPQRTIENWKRPCKEKSEQ